MSFSTAQLLEQLAQLPPARRYWIAYSGGCDSTVLLHAMASLWPQLGETELHAVHINHSLHEAAGQWAGMCRSVCNDLGIPVQELTVDARADQGDSPEAAARRVRYEAFKQVLGTGDGLLLAHHRDDQAETLLLQLLRGAGPRGLAAMPAHRPFGAGWLGRPLLEFSREELCHYAQQAGLEWIDDPSNFDTGYDRNYLRQHLMPVLLERWPSAATTLARAAAHQADAAELLTQLAAEDWQTIQQEENNSLAVTGLLRLSPERQRNLLRYWIETVHHRPLPDQQRLNRILTEVMPAAVDAEPCIEWHGTTLRRYDGRLYLTDERAPHQDKAIHWDLNSPLDLGDGRQLVAESVTGQGLKTTLCGRRDITVRYRQGGEICQPVGRGHRHALKKLFQEWRVPPWERNRVPLIYVGDEMAVVVGYCICEPYQTDEHNGLFVNQMTDLGICKD